MNLSIRHSTASELRDLMRIHREAFGSEAEPELTRALLHDTGGAPHVSLVAIENGILVGHVLLTRLKVGNDRDGCAILCPLAALPGAQRKGVGTALVTAAQTAATEMGIDTICVLGDPKYYGRFGFVDACRKGLLPPFTLPPEYSEAWQVWPESTTRKGQSRPADALMKPEFWDA